MIVGGRPTGLAVGDENDGDHHGGDVEGAEDGRPGQIDVAGVDLSEEAAEWCE